MNEPTAHEINFLSRIGTHSLSSRKTGKAALLRGYLGACELRQEWGRIDSERVISFAKEQLAREAGIIKEPAGEGENGQGESGFQGVRGCCSGGEVEGISGITRAQGDEPGGMSHERIRYKQRCKK